MSNKKTKQNMYIKQKYILLRKAKILIARSNTYCSDKFVSSLQTTNNLNIENYLYIFVFIGNCTQFFTPS
jgi:hypothetical protein